MNGEYLIVNADDLGLSPEVNDGILETVTAGAVTSVSVIVNPPHGVDPAPYLASGVSIGLHVNLTLGCPCAPIARVGSLVDAEGCFSSDVESVLERLKQEDVRAEVACQLLQFRELTGRDPSHLNVHKHLDAKDPRVLTPMMDLAAEIGVPLRAIAPSLRDLCRSRGVRTTDHFIGGVRPSPYWTRDRLREELSSVSNGITELMCHPGKNVKPIPGLWYLAERDVERETLLSSEARELFAGFIMTPFRPGLLDLETSG